MTPPATASRTHSVLRLMLSIKLSTWAIYRAQSQPGETERDRWPLSTLVL